MMSWMRLLKKPLDSKGYGNFDSGWILRDTMKGI